MTDEYLTLKQLAAYSKVSVRQLKRYLALPAEERLPHVRNGRRLLILRSSFDTWIAGGRPRPSRAPQARSFREIMQDFETRAARRPLAKMEGQRTAQPPRRLREPEASSG